MRNYFNYFTEIEEYFVRKRGKNITVPPLDWCLIELWKDNGIPLHVVLRGIDRSFESAERHQRKTPSTLFYCHPAVMEAFEEHSRAMLGTVEAENPAEAPALQWMQIADYLQTLIEQLEHAQPASLATVTARLRAIQAELRGGVHPVASPENLDAELREMGKVVAAELQKSMEKTEVQALLSEAKQETAIYKKHLSKEMYKKLVSSYFDRKVLESKGFGEFGLLNLS